MTTSKRAAVLVVILLVLGAVQFAAYTHDRETGDTVYIAASLALALCAAWFCRPVQTRLLAFALALPVSAIMLTFYTCWTGFVSDDYLGLTEDYARAPLRGVATLFVMALTLLSSLLSAVLVRKKPTPERYWPATDPYARED